MLQVQEGDSKMQDKGDYETTTTNMSECMENGQQVGFVIIHVGINA